MQAKHISSLVRLLPHAIHRYLLLLRCSDCLFSWSALPLLFGCVLLLVSYIRYSLCSQTRAKEDAVQSLAVFVWRAVWQRGRDCAAHFRTALVSTDGNRFYGLTLRRAFAIGTRQQRPVTALVLFLGARVVRNRNPLASLILQAIVRSTFELRDRERHSCVATLHRQVH